MNPYQIFVIFVKKLVPRNGILYVLGLVYSMRVPGISQWNNLPQPPTRFCVFSLVIPLCHLSRVTKV